jgi:hypothetical protein
MVEAIHDQWLVVVGIAIVVAAIARRRAHARNSEGGMVSAASA